MLNRFLLSRSVTSASVRSARGAAAVLALIGLGLLAPGCGSIDVTECASEDGASYRCPADQICAPEGTPEGCYRANQLASECEGETWDPDGEVIACKVGKAEGYCLGKICETGNCGDGIKTPDELCDGSADGELILEEDVGWYRETETGKEYVCALSCDSDLSCGNRVIDHAAGEVCDDGNNTDGDGCSADCTSPETCGDGRVDTVVGEVCDPGRNLSNANGIDYTIDESGNWIDPAGKATCASNCRNSCGNGIREQGEVCDPGGDEKGKPTCSADCQSDLSCGNGTVDTIADEGCDDGNSIDGDGCSSKCKSEYCGNGIIDAVFGEECDRGAQARSALHDGCDDTCRVDSAAWTEWQSPRTNTPASMVFLDEDGPGDGTDDGELIMVAGAHPLHGYGLTWRWADDAGWVRLQLSNGPPADVQLALTSEAPVTGPFGVLAISADSPTTWILDRAGKRWLEAPDSFDAGRQSGRRGVTYNEATGETLFVGRTSVSGGNAALWRWVSATETWEEVNIPVKGGGNWIDPVLAYDSANDRVLYYSGNSSNGLPSLSLHEVKTLDGGQTYAWRKLSNGPGHLGGASAFDPVSKRLYVMGTAWENVVSKPRALAEELWMLDVTTDTWAKCDSWFDEDESVDSLGRQFGSRSHLGAAYIPGKGVLFAGGETDDAGLGRSYHLDACETALGDGFKSEYIAPPPRRFAAGAYDARRQEAVHFSDTGETWTFDGVAWEKKNPTVSPPLRERSSMASLPEALGGVALYGGVRRAADVPAPADRTYTDLWTWDGEEWELVHGGYQDSPGPSEAPPSYGSSFAFDVAAGRLVVHGGSRTAFNVSGDRTTAELWSWAPGEVDWRRDPDAHEPASELLVDRSFSVLTYNSALGVLLSESGHNGNASRSSLYLVDSSTGAFTKARTQEGTKPQPARHAQMFVYDPERNVHVRFGGEDQDGRTYELILRENEEGIVETVWSTHEVSGPEMRRDAVFIHLPRYGQMVFGGRDVPSLVPLDDTWLYTTRRGEIEENCYSPTGHLMSLASEDEDGDGLINCNDPDCTGLLCAEDKKCGSLKANGTATCEAF